MVMKAMTKKNSAGFSLVELLVVVGIIGTLAAVGVPRYNKYMARSRNAAAVSMAGNVAVMQEGYKTVPTNTSYAGTMAALDPSNDLPNLETAIWGNGQNSLNRGTLSGASSTAYTWTATTAAVGVLGACQTANHSVTINQASALTGQTVPNCN